MRHIFLLLFCFYIVVAAEVGFKEVSKANINSILIFSSQDGLNSGIYHFKDIGISLHTYHLPLRYQYPSDTAWNYFISGDLSFSRAYVSEHTLDPVTKEIAIDSSIDTYIGGLGFGSRYTYLKGLSSSFGFEVLYSRVGVKIGKAGVDETILNFFDNNYNENISYKFETSLDYEDLISEYKVYANLVYRLYETKTSFSFDELSDFRSESSVISFSSGFETPKFYNFGTNYLTLEGRVYEHFLFGTVANASKVNRYTSLSSALYLYVPKSLEYIERFFIEVSSAQSEALEGYNIGLGFSTDF